MRSIFYTIIVAIIWQMSTPAQARLAHSKLQDLIKNSNLILETAPIKLERTAVLAGQATLTVLRVIAGKYAAKQIVIKWGNEVHEQAINDLNSDYLLFLKQNKKGEYVATQYGRSYWPFTSRLTQHTKPDYDHKTRRFDYIYPLSMVDFTTKERKLLFSPVTKQPGSRTKTVIMMKTLKKYIQNLKKR